MILTKELTGYIDNIRVDHINTDYSWWNSLYNTSMDGITGLTRVVVLVLLKV